MWPTGIFDDVAADGGKVRRDGVGREAQAVRRQCRLQVGVDDARLDAGAPVLGVDAEDVIQTGQIEQDTARRRHHPSRAVRCPTARHDRNAVIVGDRDDGGDLVPVVRAQHQFGGGADPPEVVSAVSQDRRVGDDFGDACDGLGEPLDARAVHVDAGCNLRGHVIHSFGVAGIRCELPCCGVGPMSPRLSPAGKVTLAGGVVDVSCNRAGQLSRFYRIVRVATLPLPLARGTPGRLRWRSVPGCSG